MNEFIPLVHINFYKKINNFGISWPLLQVVRQLQQRKDQLKCKQNKQNLVELIGECFFNGLYFMSDGAGALDSLCVLCLQPCLARHHGTYHRSILLLLLP